MHRSCLARKEVVDRFSSLISCHGGLGSLPTIAMEDFARLHGSDSPLFQISSTTLLRYCTLFTTENICNNSIIRVRCMYKDAVLHPGWFKGYEVKSWARWLPLGRRLSIRNRTESGSSRGRSCALQFALGGYRLAIALRYDFAETRGLQCKG